MNAGWYGLFGLLLAIGILFDVVNIGTYAANKKGGHVSGVPFLGGIFFCAALWILPVTRPFFVLGFLLDVSVYTLPGDIAYNIKAAKCANHSKIFVLSEQRLSLYIECGSQKILFDVGGNVSSEASTQDGSVQVGLVQGEDFIENADKQGINLAAVDAAVWSDATYDQSKGFAKFFEKNKKARLYIRKDVQVPQEFLDKYSKRIEVWEGDFKPVTSWADVLIPFPAGNGKTELTMIITTPRGYVLINDRSHEDRSEIIKKAREYRCDETMVPYAHIDGGRMLYSEGSDEVREETLQAGDVLDFSTVKTEEGQIDVPKDAQAAAKTVAKVQTVAEECEENNDP